MDNQFAPDVNERSAIYSPDGKHRYLLVRRWKKRGAMCQFIGLNPSTATAEEDDNTVTRCIRFAQAWGYAGLYMTNAYAWRSTDPKALLNVGDPVGPDNIATLRTTARRAAIVVAAWGTHCTDEHEQHVLKHLTPISALVCLGTTARGKPKHPLYLPRTATTEPFPPVAT